ncbi:MAG TPA: serine protease [Fimbriiglobus sp.]|jgi:S1-C subfamily serine protease
MSFPIRCPGCDVALNVSDNLIGKTIKCNKCGEMITVKSPAASKPARPAKAAVLVDDDDDDNIITAGKTRRRNDDDDDDIAPAKAARRRNNYDDDDDFDDRPRKKAATGGSKAPLLIGGLAALLLLGGAAGAYFAFFNDKKADTAQNTGTPQPSTTPETGKSEEGDNNGNGDAKEPDKTNDVKPSEKPGKTTSPQSTKNTNVKTSGDTIPPSNSAEYMRHLMDGQMDDITLRKVKEATVFIVVEVPGGGGEGSGWFGLEPGLIFTNSHVLEMKAPGSKPPSKITIYLNSGENGQTAGVKQREIPHNRIKILGVDRENDLAILQIIGEKNLPEPLEIRPSAGVREQQKVTTFGFPLGSLTSFATGGGNNRPIVSVRSSSVAARRYDKYGILRLVQIEGGVNQGNSGGPIVDADGKVVAVTVSGMRDAETESLSTLAFGVATEHVTDLLAGRLDTVEYEQPYLSDGKVKVPVRATVVDPLNRFQRAGIGKWVGDSSNLFRPPGPVRTGILPDDKHFEQVDLKYDSAKKVATGELTFDQLPPGLAYWVQPYYSNSKNPMYWNPGSMLPMSGPPVDRVAATITYKARTGTVRPIELSNSSAVSEFNEGEGTGKDRRVLRKYMVKGTEKILQPDRNDTRSAARIRLNYNDIQIKNLLGKEEIEDTYPPSLMLQLKNGINQLEAYGYVNRSGEVYKQTTNTLGVNTAAVQALGPAVSYHALQALLFTSIHIPNTTVQPLETWKTTKNVTQTLYHIVIADLQQQSTPQQRKAGVIPGVQSKDFKYIQEITYTYMGSRTRGGKREVVIKVVGDAKPAAGMDANSAKGEIKGYVFLEPGTGTVLQAEINSEIELDNSEKGFKKRISLLDNYKVVRGGQTN